MISLTSRLRRTMTALALVSFAAPTVAMAQASVGGVPICVATLTHLYYGPNSQGACFPGHARLSAATNAALTEASAAVAALRVELNALKAGMPSGLADRVTALETSVTALGTRIDEAAQLVAASVAAITARQDATDQSIAQLRAELQAELLAARSSISSPDGQYTVTATDLNGVVVGGPASSLKVHASGIGVKTGGTLLIDGGGGIDIKTGAIASLRSGGAMSIEGGANVDIKGNSTSLRSTANMLIEGGGNVDLKTGLAASWKTGTSLSLDGSSSVNIKSGGTVDVKGATVSLNGTCSVASLGARVVVQTQPAGNPSTGTVTSGSPTVTVPCSP